MGFIWILVIAFLFLCIWNMVKLGSESEERLREMIQRHTNLGMEFSDEIVDVKIQEDGKETEDDEKTTSEAKK